MKKVEAHLQNADEIIELEPFGLTAGVDRLRPVMLFREKGGDAVLPVWLSPLDAGIAVSQHHNQALPMSPHDVPLNILRVLGVKAETCLFKEIKGHQQYVEIGFSGSRKLKTQRFRADHAISFCLQARTRFYCTRDYLNRSREVDAEIERLGRSIVVREVRRSRSTYLN